MTDPIAFVVAHGCPETRLQIVRQLGFTDRPHDPPLIRTPASSKERQGGYTLEMLERAKQLQDRGLSIAEIARREGKYPSSLTKALRERYPVLKAAAERGEL